MKQTKEVKTIGIWLSKYYDLGFIKQSVMQVTLTSL